MGLSSSDLAAMLRAREAGPGPGGSLSSIFDFIDNTGNNAYAINPVHEDGQESGWGTTAGWAFKKPTDTSSNEGGSNRAAPWTFDPGDLFRAGVTVSPQAGNEGSGGYHFNVDASQFPRTAWGAPVTEAARVNERQRLINPNMVVNDPNYGRITDYRNVRADPLNTAMQTLIPSIAMAGAGALMAPIALGAFGSINPGSLISGAQGLANGNASGILGALGGALGLPSWATGLGRFALAQALRNRGNGG